VHGHHLAEGPTGKASAGDVDEIKPAGVRIDLRNGPTSILRPLLDYIPDGDADVLVVLARGLRRQHLAEQAEAQPPAWSGVKIGVKADAIVGKTDAMHDRGAS
jgi:hypothetical protein